MDVFGWLAIGFCVLLPTGTIWWCLTSPARAKSRLQVRLAVMTVALLVGLALGLLVSRLPDPADRKTDAGDEDGYLDGPRNMKVFCYAPHIKTQDPEPSGMKAPVRRRALERIVPEAQPAGGSPTSPPFASPVDGGTSGRLHPRVLQKVLLSIVRAERQDREA